MTNDDLCELLESVAIDRDRRAFAQLFQHFAPRLKSFGMRQGVNVDAAEELAQEAMLTVWRKAHTFDRRLASASTWVFTILRNKRIDLFRRDKRVEVELDERFDPPADGDSPEATVALTQSGGAVRRAMTDLSADQLTVLHKAFYEEKSHSVIAEELQLPLGTVKSRIRLALARLRSQLPETQV